MDSSPFALLFEPLQIGPVTTRNRFYQTPHCNGMGNLRPDAHARMRGIKAEGGWGIVNTENCSVHPSSDLMPEVLQTLWDVGDIPVLARMVEAVHEHNSLAGVQLAYSTYYNGNRLTREIPLGPMSRPVSGYHPVQVRGMDKQDIRNLHDWWAAASRRALQAGFDIINVDSNFSTIAFQFLSPRNQRADEYGGSLVNRTRLLKELIEVSREATQGKCAISVRLIIDELCGPMGLQAKDEGIEAIGLLAELPDLWDLVVGTWADDSPSSRFASENDHEPFMLGIKSVTTKPVVGVGRFTSPDTMASMLRRGVLDLIGAARPSIADPFLPNKIKEGRYDDIRECIGCNICVSSHFAMTNLRCTQNPTMGEEWRRGWHPEYIEHKKSESEILVIGAGPAGLECARALGQRGYQVTLAERTTQLGGRVTREGEHLPGLREWLRVRDWRITQLNKLPNVGIYMDSDLSIPDIVEFGAAHVVMATGSAWRADGVGRATDRPIPVDDSVQVLSPDDIMDAVPVINGPVLVYDDDHYYMGSVIAEKLARQGFEVVIATPAADISAFTANTLELARVVKRLDECGVAMRTHSILASVEGGEAQFLHPYTGRSQQLTVGSVVMVTSRIANDKLFYSLQTYVEQEAGNKILTVGRVGDCLAPAAIFQAVYTGHKYARDFEAEPEATVAKRERVVLQNVRLV